MKLWSINALSVELGIDRRTLSKRLDNLPPAETKRLKNRTEKSWALQAVVEHLNRSNKPKSTKNEAAEIAAAERMLENIKLFLGDKLIPDVINHPAFCNLIINGVSEELGITKAQAVQAYRFAGLAVVVAVDKLLGELRYDMPEDGPYWELGTLGIEGFALKYYSEPLPG